MAVASGSYVFIYRNLRPYFKFTLPPVEIARDEGDVWGYKSLDAFMSDSIAYTIDVAGRSICYAASYAIYDRGIELQVSTDPRYRQRGLATRVCANLILECLRRKMIPHWDAANDISAAMAERFGYRREDTYQMIRPLRPDEHEI